MADVRDRRSVLGEAPSDVVHVPSRGAEARARSRSAAAPASMLRVAEDASDAPAGAPSTRRRAHRFALLAVVVVAAALRVAWNDVTTFSPADETHYLETARALAPSLLERYPVLASEYLSQPGAWKFPSFLRWGWYGIGATICKAQPDCSHRSLAWLSTLSGVLVVLLAYAVGRARLGERAALLGGAFVAVSPLQLGLGRRALQDELVCATVLLSLWTALRVLDVPREARAWGRYAAAIAAASLAFAVKETFVLYAPAFVALWLFARERRGGGRPLDAALLLVPPLVYYAGYCLLTHSATQFFEMARVAVASLGSEYARQYQSGPPHRYLLDLLVLSPVPVLLAVGACAVIVSSRGPAERDARHLAAFAALALAAFALVSKSVRFVAATDVLASLLAAWFVVSLAERTRAPLRRVAAVVAIVAASNLWIFDRVFVQGQVGDPTTYEILRALDAIPR
ncbi:MULTISPECIES: glycosyltransferase family 39 protein [Anaeromyxobacter]|uniref:glycosyltransferase family 39 protein n=1 Tax=Anaeromyxobacter TaxID=161492 RepID=UPI001F59961C|nr:MULTISPECIES: glycosyltransferase family 39 protein [unclassified Anaeromyxobacter]